MTESNSDSSFTVGLAGIATAVDLSADGLHYLNVRHQAVHGPQVEAIYIAAHDVDLGQSEATLQAAHCMNASASTVWPIEIECGAITEMKHLRKHSIRFIFQQCLHLQESLMHHVLVPQRGVKAAKQFPIAGTKYVRQSMWRETKAYGLLTNVLPRLVRA